MNDPIRRFEYHHAHILDLSARARHALDRAEDVPAYLLERLRDELLDHFADEEEALFPYARRMLPDSAPAVDMLVASHDAICGAAVRLVYLNEHSRDRAMLHAAFERFERAFAEHATGEVAVLDRLDEVLDEGSRAELDALVRGVSTRPVKS